MGQNANATMNIENGTIVGQQKIRDINNNDDDKNHELLIEVFKSLEWNQENKKRIEELERTIKYDGKALEDIKSSINKLVEANATNKSFISKLKDFALNISTGISSSLIASAIFASLLNIR